MATKTELALAAMLKLRQDDVDPSYEKVVELVRKTNGETISKSTYQEAKNRLPELLPALTATRTSATAIAETSSPPPPQTQLPAGLHGIDELIESLHLARKLVTLLGGDKEAACKLIKEV